ncbi:MAG: MmoB/DmpM family protein [Gammaproteobacteria bacterium]|jgi:phenol hydroxylase P2 protein|nr:MmoB/DmpM family protein [Gammaproteobacteria bacterium]
MSRDKVFIAFQTNEDSRPIVEAILEDNPEATVDEQPAMVKILAPGRLVVKRSTIEDKIGRDFVLQSIHINLISLAGNISEDEDEFVLAWHQA